MGPRDNMNILEERKMCFLIVGSNPGYIDCALPSVMIEKHFRGKGGYAATCCVWQRKGMHFGLGFKENLDCLGYCHLLKADCAEDRYGNSRDLTHGSSWAISKPAANISSWFMRCLTS
jgi:hypothetical protein